MLLLLLLLLLVVVVVVVVAAAAAAAAVSTIILITVNVKFTLEQAMKAQSGGQRHAQAALPQEREPGTL